jgi:hypothetical protein
MTQNDRFEQRGTIEDRCYVRARCPGSFVSTDPENDVALGTDHFQVIRGVCLAAESIFLPGTRP